MQFSSRLEAICITESRPELQAALMEVKERNLRLLPKEENPQLVIDR